jgi:hypothetical protein
MLNTCKYLREVSLRIDLRVVVFFLMFFCTSPLPETGSGVRLCGSFCARWLGTLGMQGPGLAQAQRLQMWQKKITKNITSSIRFFQI